VSTHELSAGASEQLDPDVSSGKNGETSRPSKANRAFRYGLSVVLALATSVMLVLMMTQCTAARVKAGDEPFSSCSWWNQEEKNFNLDVKVRDAFEGVEKINFISQGGKPLSATPTRGQFVLVDVSLSLHSWDSQEQGQPEDWLDMADQRIIDTSGENYSPSERVPALNASREVVSQITRRNRSDSGRVLLIFDIPIDRVPKELSIVSHSGKAEPSGDYGAVNISLADPPSRQACLSTATEAHLD
jgi:hypothetical protein